MRRFLLQFGTAAALTLAAVGMLNSAVDPYRIFGAARAVSVPQASLAHYDNRDLKRRSLLRTAPEVLILGTSRSEFALDPGHAAFGGRPVANLATLAQPYAESLATLRAAVAAGAPRPVGLVVMGLDFELANTWLPAPPDTAALDFAPLDDLHLRLSLPTLRASAVELLGWDDGSRTGWHAGGQRLWGERNVRELGGNRRMFEVSESRYLREYFFPPPRCRFDFEAPGRPAPLDDLRSLFALAHRERIDLRLFVSPAHARQWEIVALAGLWPQWEEWKRRVVRLNEEEARRAGRAPFALWDFSGYHTLASEPLPDPATPARPMRHYFDSAHYTGKLGDLVLDRLLDHHAPGRQPPADLGEPLSAATLEAHLQRVRAQRQAWQARHADEAAALRRVADDSAAKRRCAG